jgi:hypothetical protein
MLSSFLEPKVTAGQKKTQSKGDIQNGGRDARLFFCVDLM